MATEETKARLKPRTRIDRLLIEVAHTMEDPEVNHDGGISIDTIVDMLEEQDDFGPGETRDEYIGHLKNYIEKHWFKVVKVVDNTVFFLAQKKDWRTHPEIEKILNRTPNSLRL